jgi:hypothetical protein
MARTTVGRMACVASLVTRAASCGLLVTVILLLMLARRATTGNPIRRP